MWQGMGRSHRQQGDGGGEWPEAHGINATNNVTQLLGPLGHHPGCAGDAGGPWGMAWG